MKNVRIWFKKDDECRYISHLDLNRCVLRALHKSKIPVWHTEGFNPHPFATFPLPLSLGFRGINECMDIRLVDEISDEKLISDFNACMPACESFCCYRAGYESGKNRIRTLQYQNKQ